MPKNHSKLQALLKSSSMTGKQLAVNLAISQPSLSRLLAEMTEDVLRVGAAASTKYLLRNRLQQFNEIPVYRVNTQGKISLYGTLYAVYPSGYVMMQSDANNTLYHGIPWWLLDMRPQGYLGRLFAAAHADELGLTENIQAWSDNDIFNALIHYGDDFAGNWIVGEPAKQRFLSAPAARPIGLSERAQAYAKLAEQSLKGADFGSSAGGEQAKFLTYVETQDDAKHVAAKHVLVKFTSPESHPISQRWRDLLLAEHWALQTLAEYDFPAPPSEIIDIGQQRFFQVERFDRVGALGRKALISLQALDAEFVGKGDGAWHVISQSLLAQKIITAQAHHQITLLYAFGKLIANTDMHLANISLQSDHGIPYQIAPAYDMLPMLFAPRTGGSLQYQLPEIKLPTDIPHTIWQQAAAMAKAYINHLTTDQRFSLEFQPCLNDLNAYIEGYLTRIERLG